MAQWGNLGEEFTRAAPISILTAGSYAFEGTTHDIPLFAARDGGALVRSSPLCYLGHGGSPGVHGPAAARPGSRWRPGRHPAGPGAVRRAGGGAGTRARPRGPVLPRRVL